MKIVFCGYRLFAGTSINPRYGNAINNLGIALKDMGREEEAVKCYKDVLTLNPNHANAYNNLANVMKDRGDFDQAIEYYQKVLTLQPDFAEVHNNLGAIIQEKGYLQEAISRYRKAIEISPDYAAAHRHLAIAVKHEEYDHEIAAMEELYSRDDITDEQRMHLGFGLGKAFEDLKEYKKAFEYLQKANGLKRNRIEYSTSKESNFFQGVKSHFTENLFERLKGCGIEDGTPIFIVGMPRSGTTLIEQILASHPEVYGAGELNCLSSVGDSVFRAIAFGRFDREYPGDKAVEVISKVGTDYIRELREHSREAKHITDKMPHNFLRVGFIRLALPNAKVIHCRRDPMDTCLSMYKKYFSARNAHHYCYDLQELGEYYNLYKGLMAHWRETLPGFMLEMDYEDLVADQKEQTRRLLDYCGLPWSDKCLSFHETERKVSTASFAQVRQPIYKDSVRLWKRYEEQLEPLRKIVGA